MDDPLCRLLLHTAKKLSEANWICRSGAALCDQRPTRRSPFPFRAVISSLEPCRADRCAEREALIARRAGVRVRVAIDDVLHVLGADVGSNEHPARPILLASGQHK